MNAVIQLLAELADKDIRLWLEDGKLRFSAPEGALTTAIRDRIVGNKQAIIDFLGQAQKHQLTQIPRCDRNQRLVASFAQQRLWFLNRLDPQSPAYNMAGALRLQGVLNLDALTRTLHAIISRHEVLHTSYHDDDAGLALVIEPLQSVHLVAQALPAGIHGSIDDIIQTLAQREAATPFDLARDHVLRVTLYRIADNDHLLLTTLHHIASDGWSMGILVTELAALYSAFCDGKASTLPELPLQYTDYAAWQRQWLSGERLEKQLQFWRDTLTDVPVLQLPTDRPRTALAGSNGNSHGFELAPALTASLNQLARQHDATLFMVLAAALRVLLARYSGQTDFCIGTPVAGRSQVQLETLIGCFVNTVAIRGDLDTSATFSDAVRAEKAAAQIAFDHQDVPFEQVVDTLRLARDMAFTPLFQVMLVLQNTPVNYDTRLPNLVIRPIELKKHAAMFDLKFTLNEYDGRIVAEIEYRSDLWNDASISSLSKSFITLLDAIVRDCERPISEYPLLTADEMSALMSTTGASWNATQHPLPAVNALHTLIEQQVQRTPAATAVSCESNCWSYEELNRRANQLAHYLRQLGIGPGALVGVCIERDLNMSLALLATLKAGAAYVPFDPTFPADRLGFMLDDTAVDVMLTATHLVDVLPAQVAHVLCLDRDTTQWQSLPASNLDVDVKPDDLFNVIFTSGSTGKPKGVMVPHIGIINRLLWMQDMYPLAAGDRVLQKTPYSFDVSVWELFWPLLVGAQIVYAKPEGHKDPDYLCELIQRENIGTLHFVPSMLGIFLQNDKVSACTSIKRVFCSGEALQLAHEKRFFEKLPRAELHNLYGPTEASVDVSWYACTPNSPYRSVPIGKPVWNTQLHVLDTLLQPVPVGVIGELYIGGIQLAHGYLKRDELTRNTFIDNPHYRRADGTPGHPSPKLYKTGDLVRHLPDGNIEYIGRVDFQVKVRGLRIELGEIETVLMRHTAVKEALVVVSEIAPGNVIIVAYWVPRDDVAAPDAQALRSFLQRNLPQYMIPNVFMVLDEIPLSANGKANRKALPPADLSQLARADYVAPRNDTEQAIADIFAEVLGLPRVGIDENFFELGGHSLLAMRIVARLRERLGTELPLRAMFGQPTVAGIGAALAQSLASALPPLTSADRDSISALPLSFSQQRLWLIDQLQPGSALYNIPLAVRLSGPLNTDALQRAFAEVVRRHDSLRTHFISDHNGNSQQVITPYNDWSLARENISGDQQQIEQRALMFLAEPFQLDVQPLLRVLLLNTGRPDDHVLLVSMHHIISDGWSMDVLLHELSQLYLAFAHGEPSPLPALSLQYADFAVWQQQLAATGYFESQFDYWKKQLADTAPLQLPLDKPRPAQLDPLGRQLHFTLPADLTSALKALSQRQHATLYMTLLAAFQLLLARYARQDDIVVGSPIANRTQPQLEPIIGFFVNTLVMRSRIDADATFEQLLAQVKQTTLDALQHQDLPFEQLIEAMRVPRDLSMTPLFQVMFVLQNNQSAGTSDAGMQLGELALRPLRDESVAVDTVAKFDITLSMSERDDQLAAELVFRSSLWHEHTMQGFCRHFEALLSDIVSRPQAKLREYTILTAAEIEQQLIGMNAAKSTALPTSALQPIHSRFEQMAARYGEHTAITINSGSGKQSISYRELNTRANQIAHALLTQGVAVGDYVGLCLERSVELIAGMLGILKAGAAYVPLDAHFPAERLQYILEDSQARVLVTESALLDTLPDFGNNGSGTRIVVDTDAAMLATQAGSNPAVAVALDATIYIIYTSGTTGKPKGCPINHGNVARLFTATDDEFRFNENDVWTLFHSFAFDFSVWEIWGALLFGGRLVIVPHAISRAPDEFYRLLIDEGVTVLNQTPSAFSQLVAIDAMQPQPASHKLRCVVFGGEALDFNALRPWVKRYGLDAPVLINMYGITETTVHVTYYPLTHKDFDQGGSIIGTPIRDLHVHLLDAHGQLAPLGVPGEIHVSGPGVSNGYLKRPDLSAERFIDNPFAHLLPAAIRGSHQRLYRSGDLARYSDNGNIEYMGRIDLQVKIRGHRIELGEIMAQLAALDDVREAVVIVSENPARENGGGGARLIGYLLKPADRDDIDVGHVRAQLKATLPDYMIPSLFVVMDAWPLTPNGKIDKKALPVPDVAALATQEYIAPRNDIETELAAIWHSLLGIDAISVTANFFELGGHSLLATQVAARIRAHYRIDFAIRHLFEFPTIAELAIRIEHDVQQQALLINDENVSDDEEEFTL